MAAIESHRHLKLLKWGAGVAVILWGASKIAFVNDWTAPYEQAFYTALPVDMAIVYVLGAIQVILGVAIIQDFYRRVAAYTAAGMAMVSLLATVLVLFEPGNPVAANPAPLGIKLVWFFFNPIALKIVLVAAAEAPDSPRTV